MILADGPQRALVELEQIARCDSNDGGGTWLPDDERDLAEERALVEGADLTIMAGLIARGHAHPARGEHDQRGARLALGDHDLARLEAGQLQPLHERYEVGAGELGE